MSLVAYDSSEGSGEESEDDGKDSKMSQNGPKVELNSASELPKNEPVVAEAKKVVTDPAKIGLFSLLPAPKRPTLPEVVTEDPLPKNLSRKEPIKIMIPSLKEFEADDEEERQKEKRRPSKVGSGLMSLLPNPQNISMKETAKQLVPLSVSRKKVNQPEPKSTKRMGTLKETTPRAMNTVSPTSKLQDGNESDEETPLTDFFSLSESTKEPELPSTEMQAEPISKSNFGNESENRGSCSSSSDYVNSVDAESSNMRGSYYPTVASSNLQYNTSMDTTYDNVYTQNASYDVPGLQNFNYSEAVEESGIPELKNEAIVRLAGKKRSGKESIEFVDVNGDDLVAGRDEWLLKSLSETDSYQPAPKRSDQPSAMHRRKHQITYLAFQAKAREQELKNQWSMNRMTKKQTQSKYGF